MSALCRKPDTTHRLPLELYGSRETLYSGTFEGAAFSWRPLSLNSIIVMNDNQNSKMAIRRVIRAERAKLSKQAQAEKAHQLMSLIIQLPIFIQSQSLAGYWPNDHEINPCDILTQAYQQGKFCYLPKLDPDPLVQMHFVEYHPGDALIRNRLGILEPTLGPRKSIAARALDLVLVPLLAFDQTGRRLGMGKGYYDQTFAFRKSDPHSKPFLLGIAYDLQKVPELPSEEWDIPLDGVATETHYQAWTFLS